MTLRPFALERFFARHEFTARYLLCSSDPEAMSVGDLLAYEPDSAAAAAELQGLWLGYTDTWGHPQLREAIAALYEPTLSAASVLVHSGAEEPIFVFMNVVLSRGDHLITHFPCYQSHYALAESLGVSVSRWEARPQADWLPDPDELAGLIRPETRAVILSFPHNPTGALLDRACLEAVVALCRRHGLWLFSDEVYRGLEHDSARRLPAAADLYERAVSLGAMAKVYGLAGLRIGWVASRDAELLQRMAAFKDYLTICNSAPSEFLARVALRHGEALIARSREIVRDNLTLLDAAFARQASLLGWVRPTAGTTAFVELRGSLAERGAQAFCEALVERHGVLLAPGALFDYPGDRHFRLGFARRNLPTALAEMEAALPELASP